MPRSERFDVVNGECEGENEVDECQSCELVMSAFGVLAVRVLDGAVDRFDVGALVVCAGPDTGAPVAGLHEFAIRCGRPFAGHNMIPGFG